MEYEIELKLLTNEKAGELIESKLLPILKSQVIKQTVILSNHYFDTPDRLLRRDDMGLRIRTNDEYCEQTLTTSGQSVGGLHSRPEYNVSLDNYDTQTLVPPNLTLFESSAWPDNFDLPSAQASLECMFTTHFTRHIYLLEDDTTIIEMVWDKGEIKGRNAALPICEIELELKAGEPSVLFDLAKKIAAVMPLSMGTESKAARGYKLADNTAIATSILLENSAFENSLLNEDEFILLINKALTHFQLYSSKFQLEGSKYHNQNTLEITKSLALLSASLDNFFDVTGCQVLADIQQQINSFITQWSPIGESCESGENLSDKNWPKAITLLSSAQAITFQLDLVKVLLEKPWMK